MDLGLAGKAVLITGASAGIGAATAARLAGEGAALFLAARSEQRLTALARDLADRHGVSVGIWAGDLADPLGPPCAVEAAVAFHGRLDGLVLSAGASQGGVFWEIPDHVWMDSLDLKFMSSIRTLRAVLPIMRRQSYGRIVVVAGSTGKQPASRMLPGGAANAALLAVTKGLADEVASEGVAINAVNPGPTRTERWTRMMDAAARSRGITPQEVEEEFLKTIPMARLAEPDEIARMIAFLVSDAAANMTGSSLTADGGWTRALA